MQVTIKELAAVRTHDVGNLIGHSAVIGQLQSILEKTTTLAGKAVGTSHMHATFSTFKSPEWVLPFRVLLLNVT